MDKKILIIGDDEKTQMILLRAFSRTGLQASATSKGTNAVLQIFLTQPDLIILDVLLSDPDKWGLLQQIRQLSTVPVIVLTIADDYRSKIEGLDRGADYVMVKPFDVRELRARINALFRRVHKGRTMRVSAGLQAGACVPMDLVLMAGSRRASSSH